MARYVLTRNVESIDADQERGLRDLIVKSLLHTFFAMTKMSQPQTAFYLLGGEPAIRAIVDRFYDLMDSDPDYADLRAMHAPDLGMMRASLAGFLKGWTGGPRDWFEQNPGKCMMSAHKPFAISPDVAAQWADAMQRAIADVSPANTTLAKEMSDVLSRMALSMAH